MHSLWIQEALDGRGMMLDKQKNIAEPHGDNIITHIKSTRHLRTN